MASLSPDIEIIVASHNLRILKENLLKSDIVTKYPLTVRSGFTNIPKAYNSHGSTAEIKIWVHHDVFLYYEFEKQLLSALKNAPSDWQVLGLAGVKLENNVRKIYGYIMDRGKPWGAPVSGFVEVDTLDELLVITKGDLKFDEQFEQDFYAADICMQARVQGKKCYVFKSFCDHNSGRKIGGRTESFYISKERFKQKWKEYLPIATTCGLITDDVPA